MRQVMLFFLSIILQFIMERLSPAKCLQNIQLYNKNKRSTRNMFCALRRTYDTHNRSTEHIICYTIKNFDTQFLFWIIHDQIDHIQHVINKRLWR